MLLGQYTRHSTFYISMTYAPTILITMHPNFIDFMFQRYTLQLYSGMSVNVYTKNSNFFVLEYDILELDDRYIETRKIEGHVAVSYSIRRKMQKPGALLLNLILNLWLHCTFQRINRLKYFTTRLF
jgi:hypothetical protein